MEKIVSWKSHGKWSEKIKVMEIKKYPEKSHGTSLLLITNHSREVPIIPCIQAYCNDLAMGGFRFMF